MVLKDFAACILEGTQVGIIGVDTARVDTICKSDCRAINGAVVPICVIQDCVLEEIDAFLVWLAIINPKLLRG